MYYVNVKFIMYILFCSKIFSQKLRDIVVSPFIAFIFFSSRITWTFLNQIISQWPISQRNFSSRFDVINIYLMVKRKVQTEAITSGETTLIAIAYLSVVMKNIFRML